MPRSTKKKSKRKPAGHCRDSSGCNGKISRDGYCAKHDYVHNKKYHQARQKKNYPKYRKKILAREAKRYEENKDEICAGARAKYAEDIVESRKKSNKYYQKNKIKLAAEERKRYWKEREIRCQKTAKYYKNNKAKRTKQIQKYQKEHPEVGFKSHKKRVSLDAAALSVTATAYVYAIMAWKKVLLKRDKHSCVYCGAYGKKVKLEGHHIIFRRTEVKMALVENNGVILCKSCHKEVHRLNPIRFVRRN